MMTHANMETEEDDTGNVTDILDEFFKKDYLDPEDIVSRRQLARLSLKLLTTMFEDRLNFDVIKLFAEDLGKLVLSKLLTDQKYRLLKRTKVKTATNDVYEFIKALENNEASADTVARLQVKPDLNKSFSSENQGMLDVLLERLEIVEDKAKKFEEMYENMLYENLKLKDQFRKCVRESPEPKRKTIKAARTNLPPTDSIYSTPVNTSLMAPVRQHNFRASILKEQNSSSAVKTDKALNV